MRYVIEIEIYFPLDPHTWKPVVLWQMAVRDVVVVVVEVEVVVTVLKAKRTRG